MTDKKDPDFLLSEKEEAELVNKIMQAVELEKQRALEGLPEVYQYYADYLVPIGNGKTVIPFVETIGLMASQMWLDRFLHQPVEYHVQ